MFSPTVVSVAESKSPGIASTVVILSVWVYGTVLPVRGLFQNAECQRSWMTRPRTAAGHLPQICPDDQLLDPPRADPEQGAGGDHADQGPFGPLAAFQQPLRKVGAFAHNATLATQLGKLGRRSRRSCASLRWPRAPSTIADPTTTKTPIGTCRAAAPPSAWVATAA